MNALELKGGLTEMIAGVKSPDILLQLHKLVAQIIQDAQLEESVELTTEQEVVLDQEIEESFDPKNLIDHQLVQEKMARWLN